MWSDGQAQCRRHASGAAFVGTSTSQVSLFGGAMRFGSMGGQNLVLHLRKLSGGLMWEHSMRSFDEYTSNLALVTKDVAEIP
jgi:hypothetical protein